MIWQQIYALLGSVAPSTPFGAIPVAVLLINSVGVCIRLGYAAVQK
ncbi:MAG: hypothetical protein ACI8WM_003355 [Burkholderiaceae bacterium]|jgi:hypothetical protein